MGWLAARKVKDGTAADLILAGRAMPLWIATLTMTATWVDGGYLLGTAEAVYHSSIALGAQGGLCCGASLILGGQFFANTMRRHEFTTLIDQFEARFGKVWGSSSSSLRLRKWIIYRGGRRQKFDNGVEVWPVLEALRALE